METTFVMIKPDGVQRGLIGEIVKRFEQKGLKLKAAKLVGVSREQAEFHYAEHAEKSFYGELIDFIVSGPVFAMVWEGDQAIALSRALIGKTNILEAVPGTVRGDFVVHTGTNIIHGSDSVESAAREIGNFFAESELITYDRAIDAWI